MTAGRRVTRRARDEGGGKTADLTWEATETTIRAKATAEKAGLPLAPRPADASPELPEDPTALDDAALMTLFTKFVAWADYSATHLALAEVDEATVKTLLDAKKDVLLIRHMPSSEALRKREDTMTRVRAEVDTDAEVLDLEQQRLNAYALRKLLAATFERYDRDAALLSRELTRRTGGQDPKTRRASRWAP